MDAAKAIIPLLLMAHSVATDSKCNPIDLGFLLDESGSIGSTNWAKILNFTENVVDALDIGSDKTRVSVTKFRGSAAVAFYLNKYKTKSDVLQKIQSLSFSGGGTNTADGLKLMRTSVFQSANGDRSAYKNIAVVFTDGKSSSRTKTIVEATNLHKAGVRVLCVAVGTFSSSAKSELEAIATPPNSTNLIIRKSFDQLKDVISTVKKDVCRLSIESGCTATQLISGSTHKVSDSYLTASTQYGGAGSHGPARSRLNTKDENGKAGGWCAIPRTTDQWIQVDFRKMVLVTSVATQGRNLRLSEWVTSYQLQYSDGRGWKTYMEDGKNKTFSGNYDRDSIRKNTLKEPVYARYIRLNPRRWNNWICMRWELYGCSLSACGSTPIISGTTHKVDDCQLSASAEYTSWGALAPRSRLNTKDETGKAGAWCSGKTDLDQWIQVDFKRRVLVSAITSQGRYYYSSRSYYYRVYQFHLLYSQDGYTWTTYKTSSSPYNFGSNHYSQYTYKQSLSYPFIARFVRVNPKAWRTYMCLRWEVYGCPL